MYFCYVDESGDTGMHDEKTPDKSGSKYFIFSSIFLDISNFPIPHTGPRR